MQSAKSNVTKQVRALKTAREAASKLAANAWLANDERTHKLASDAKCALDKILAALANS